MGLVGSVHRQAYSRESDKTVTDRGSHDENGQLLQVYSPE
jgi:hypothetical protein